MNFDKLKNLKFKKPKTATIVWCVALFIALTGHAVFLSKALQVKQSKTPKYVDFELQYITLKKALTSQIPPPESLSPPESINLNDLIEEKDKKTLSIKNTQSAQHKENEASNTEKESIVENSKEILQNLNSFLLNLNPIAFDFKSNLNSKTSVGDPSKDSNKQFKESAKSPSKGNQSLSKNFSLSNYNWPHQSYMGRFGKQFTYNIHNFPPMDYVQGQVPEGGAVYVEFTIDRKGNLETYEMTGAVGASDEMVNSVINALVGVSNLPALPDDFEDSELIVKLRVNFPNIKTYYR